MLTCCVIIFVLFLEAQTLETSCEHIGKGSNVPEKKKKGKFLKEISAELKVKTHSKFSSIQFKYIP